MNNQVNGKSDRRGGVGGDEQQGPSNPAQPQNAADDRVDQRQAANDGIYDVRILNVHLAQGNLNHISGILSKIADVENDVARTGQPTKDRICHWIQTYASQIKMLFLNLVGVCENLEGVRAFQQIKALLREFKISHKVLLSIASTYQTLTRPREMRNAAHRKNRTVGSLKLILKELHRCFKAVLAEMDPDVDNDNDDDDEEDDDEDDDDEDDPSSPKRPVPENGIPPSRKRPNSSKRTNTENPDDVDNPRKKHRGYEEDVVEMEELEEEQAVIPLVHEDITEGNGVPADELSLPKGNQPDVPKDPLHDSSDDEKKLKEASPTQSDNFDNREPMDVISPEFHPNNAPIDEETGGESAMMEEVSEKNVQSSSSSSSLNAPTQASGALEDAMDEVPETDGQNSLDRPLEDAANEASGEEEEAVVKPVTQKKRRGRPSTKTRMDSEKAKEPVETVPTGMRTCRKTKNNSIETGPSTSAVPRRVGSNTKGYKQLDKPRLSAAATKKMEAGDAKCGEEQLGYQTLTLVLGVAERNGIEVSKEHSQKLHGFADAKMVDYQNKEILWKVKDGPLRSKVDNYQDLNPYFDYMLNTCDPEAAKMTGDNAFKLELTSRSLLDPLKVSGDDVAMKCKEGFDKNRKTNLVYSNIRGPVIALPNKTLPPRTELVVPTRIFDAADFEKENFLAELLSQPFSCIRGVDRATGFQREKFSREALLEQNNQAKMHVLSQLPQPPEMNRNPELNDPTTLPWKTPGNKTFEMKLTEYIKKEKKIIEIVEKDLPTLLSEKVELYDFVKLKDKIRKKVGYRLLFGTNFEFQTKTEPDPYSDDDFECIENQKKPGRKSKAEKKKEVGEAEVEETLEEKDQVEEESDAELGDGEEDGNGEDDDQNGDVEASNQVENPEDPESEEHDDNQEAADHGEDSEEEEQDENQEAEGHGQDSEHEVQNDNREAEDHVQGEVPVPDEEKFVPQYEEIQKLPQWMQPKGSKNLLRLIRWNIEGLNTPNVYFKYPGSRTSAHAENSALGSKNWNFGPGNCLWFIVSLEFAQQLNELIKKKSGKNLDNTYWPSAKEIRDAGIPVQVFLQKPGDLVYVSYGSIHWVQSLGFAENLSWNIGVETKTQLDVIALFFDFVNRNGGNPLFPVAELFWRIAIEKKFTDDFGMFTTIKHVLEKLLVQIEVEWMSIKEGNRGKPRKQQEEEKWNRDLRCDSCKNVLFNVYCRRKRFVRNKTIIEKTCVEHATGYQKWYKQWFYRETPDYYRGVFTDYKYSGPPVDAQQE